MNYIKGNKYVPHSKSLGNPLFDSQWSRREHKQEFLYYIRQFSAGEHVFSLDIDAKEGDIYLASDLTPYVEPGLPKKWFIDRVLSGEIVDWFNEKFPFIKYSTYERERCYLCLPAIDHSLFPHSTSDKDFLLISGYEQITLEQFKNHVKQKEMEIIGYKCPTIFFGGKVHTGDIYKLIKGAYPATYGVDTYPVLGNLPAEIVEKWQSVYHEYRIGDSIFVKANTTSGCSLKIGDIVKITNLHKGFVSTSQAYGGDIFYRDFRPCTLKEIEKENLVVIEGFTALKIEGGVKFSCQTIETSILLSIKDLLERKKFVFKCSVGNTNITIDHINKLL